MTEDMQPTKKDEQSSKKLGKMRTNRNNSLTRRTAMKIAGIGGIAGVAGVSSNPVSASSSSNDGSFTLVETTISEIHSAMLHGDLTAEELVKQYIDRIDEYDDELNAVINLNQDATDRAQELDDEYEESGFVGPLHGIPVLLKDNTNTADMPTTGGSVLFEDTIPPEDAFITKKLREAGAIILAKANLGEFSYGSTSSLGGTTKNPYDTDIEAGGSSAGSGSGTAANLAAISVGTDTGGSIRNPANNNALVGIRPTTGLISRSGIIPLSSTLDTAGPMTRTVADTAEMLDVMAGYDPDDPKTAESVGNVPHEGYTSYLNPNGLDGAKIGVLRQLFSDVDDEAIEVIESAISKMDGAGATIIDIEEIPDLVSIADKGDVIEYEIDREMQHYLDELGDDAPVDSLTEIVDSDTVEGVIADITFPELDDVNTDNLDEDNNYLNALLAGSEIRELLFKAMADNELDAVVYPYSAVGWMSPVAAFPSINVPAGQTEDGLPQGIEFMTKPFEESLLIELAYSFEQNSMARAPPEEFGEL